MGARAQRQDLQEVNEVEYSQSFKDAVLEFERKTNIYMMGEEERQLFRLFVPRKDFNGVEALRRELNERCKQLEIQLEQERKSHSRAQGTVRA